jgi:transcriptional regulator with XRE-family HTH domain
METRERARTRPIHKVVGARVRQLREGAGLNQTELAELLVERGHSFGQTAVGKLERGARILTLDEAYALSLIFMVDLGDFLSSGVRENQRQLKEAREEIAGRWQRIANERLSKAEEAELERQINYYSTVANLAKSRLRVLSD